MRPVSVPWSAVRLRAHSLIVAFLDDIKQVGEVFLTRPFTMLLREEGPRVGLHFEKLAKNFAYVPLRFRRVIADLFPDAVVVDDETVGLGGDSPSCKLKAGAAQMGGDRSRLLITLSGLESLMGAPLRVIERNESEQADRGWLKTQIRSKLDETKRLFAHLGLSPVDDAIKNQGLDGFQDSSEVASLPDDQAQLQFLIARC